MKNLKEILASQDRDTIQEIVYWTCVEHGLVDRNASCIPDFNSVEFELSVTIKELQIRENLQLRFMPTANTQFVKDYRK